MDFPVFQFMPVASPPFTDYCQEESGFTFFTPPHHVFRNTNNIPRSLLFSSLSSPISLWFSSDLRCPNLPIIFMAIHWTCSSNSISLIQENPELDTELQMCLTSKEKRRRTTSFHLLKILCLMQPRKLRDAFATSTYYCLTLYSVSTWISGSFSPKLLSSHSAPASTGAWGYSSPRAALSISLFRKVLSAHFPSLWRPLSMAVQPSGQSNFLPALYHLPACWEHALPQRPGH